MELLESQAYIERGLDSRAQERLALLGDLIIGAALNITAITEPGEIERLHFLDSLSLLELDYVLRAGHLVDVGSGGGLPALVVALALPKLRVVAVEAHEKKCAFIERAAAALSLRNIEVRCARVEEYGRAQGRERYDVAVSRALASLPVVAEYSLPLVAVGGTMVAMKGAISDQERIQAEKALGILGCDALEVVQLHPFPGAENRVACLGRKTRPTPDRFPRRPGVPRRRPLGG